VLGVAVCLQFLSPETVVSSASNRIGSASATKLLGNINQIESQYILMKWNPNIGIGSVFLQRKRTMVINLNQGLMTDNISHQKCHYESFKNYE
jgi:hypothetical protein